MPSALSQFMSGLTLRMDHTNAAASQEANAKTRPSSYEYDDSCSSSTITIVPAGGGASSSQNQQKVVSIVVDNARKHVPRARASTGELLPVISENSSCWSQSYRMMEENNNDASTSSLSISSMQNSRFSSSSSSSSSTNNKNNKKNKRWSGGCSPMQMFTKGSACSKAAAKSHAKKHSLIQPKRRDSDPVIVKQLFQSFMEEFDPADLYDDSSSEFEVAVPPPAAPTGIARPKSINRNQRSQSLDDVLFEAQTVLDL